MCLIITLMATDDTEYLHDQTEVDSVHVIEYHTQFMQSVL